MIIEPHFPEAFIDLITTIIARQLEVDKAKAQINEEDAEILFKSIDHLHCGQIFIEDLYAFLKRKGLVLSKKDIKFVNRYFGFSNNEQLDLQLFRNNFVQFLNPKHNDQSKAQNSEEALLKMIKIALKSYEQIEELRLKVADDIFELQSCLQAFYPETALLVTKTMFIEVLSSMSLYSRLNHHFVCNYMIGYDSHDITLKQLFWKELSNNFLSEEIPEPKGYKNPQKATSTKEGKKRQQKMDILTQIENIQTAIKVKKQKAAENKQRVLHEEPQYKAIAKIHQHSQSNLLTLPRKKSSVGGWNVTLKEKEQHRLQIDQIENQNDKVYQKDIDEILKRSIRDYNQDFQENEKEIERLYRNRRLSKSREEALSRASSCAKLKMQEVQRKVMGKSTLNNIQSGLRTPMTGEIKHELRSRFSSLKKK